MTAQEGNFMPKAATIRISHDCDSLDVIDKFAAALKTFGITIVDDTDPDTKVVEIFLTDQPIQPGETQWGS